MTKAQAVPHYLVKSVDRRWWRAISTAQQRVLVFSPYLTPRTAEAAASAPSSVSREIHTLMDINNFAAGASFLNCLRRLLHAGVDLYHVPRLHAKIVIVDEAFATIGSQNLTSNGVRNREASVLIEDPKHVLRIFELLQPWLATRIPITVELLDEFEASLPPIKKLYRQAHLAARMVHESLAQALRKNQAEMPPPCGSGGGGCKSPQRFSCNRS